jgi:predicted RNA-binding Zn ribbon-like protein
MSLGVCIKATLPDILQPVVRVTPESIKLRGGALSIDFANSVDWTEDEQEVVTTDALLEPDSLDRWGVRLGVAGRPGGPEELELARGLRTALHRIFSALARSEQPDEFSLARLRFAYAQAVAAGTLVRRADGGFGLEWREDEPRRVRFAVAADAVALLADPARIARLHRCPGRDCGWIFLDTSGRRRWCSMQTCGSREKMRRMYERKRAEREAGGPATPGPAAEVGGSTA